MYNILFTFAFMHKKKIQFITTYQFEFLITSQFIQPLQFQKNDYSVCVSLHAHVCERDNNLQLFIARGHIPSISLLVENFKQIVNTIISYPSDNSIWIW